MYKHIILVSFASLLLFMTPHAGAESVLDSDLDSITSSSFEADTTSANADDESTDSGESVTTRSATSVDANGNLTIKPNEDYTLPIDLVRGSLTIGSGASATKGVRVRSGNVILGDNSEVIGNVTVDSGNLTIGENADISGNVSVGGTLTVKDNVDVTGTISVASSGVITVGSNVDLESTLTSSGGLKVGANTDIKLFLSGQSAQIDGKIYKLGGKILSSGANTSVGLPYVPKPKDGEAVMVTTTTSASVPQAQEGESVQSSDIEQASTEGNVEGSDSFVLPDIANIMNEEDITAYVSDIISSNMNVRTMDLTPEEVSLDYKTPVALFGFIPMSVPTHITVSKDKEIGISYPWYSFLMATNKQEVQNAVLESVKEATTGETSAGFSAKIQATIANSILSAFKNLF